MDFSAIDSVCSFVESRPDLLYTPGPTIGAFLDSPARMKLLRAPNQIGKTLAGAVLAIRRTLAWSGDGPGVLLVMIADLDNLYPSVCSKIHEVMPAGLLDGACRYVEGIGYRTHGRRLVKFASGATWEFRGGRGEQMSAASITCDLGAWIDEIPIRGHFSEAVRATQRYGSPVWVTLTPVGRAVAWFRGRVEGIDGKPPDDVDTAGAPLWVQFVPELSPVECPWLTRERIAETVALTDPAEAPQRLRGAWEGPTTDRIFTGMSGALVVPAPPPSRYRVTVAMDHGELAGHEHALLLLHDATRIVIADEYVNPTATTPEADAAGIVAMLARNGAHPSNVDRWVGDVNSSGKHGAGRSVNQDLGEAISRHVGAPGLVRIEKPNKAPGSVEYGTRLVNFALHRGDILVCEAAKHATRALWHHREDGDDYTHAVDTLRYGAVDLLRRRPEYAGIRWGYG